MTNLERRKQLTEEFMQWLFRSEENRNPEPDWCKGQHCGDVNGDCRKCFIKWFYKKVKMTNFEKWKQKLAEAKNSCELTETLGKMYDAHIEWCKKVPESICDDKECKVCFVEWLNEEVEE